MRVPADPHAVSADEVAAALRVDPSAGLASAEIEERRRQFGRNAIIHEAGRSAASILLHQFASVIVVLLAIAAAVAFTTRDAAEGIAILAVLVINALIGFFTEWQAERALSQLRLQVRATARVRRDGREAMIDAEELVVGDTIVVEAGSHTPADARLVEVAGLQLEESALTGESLPVEKYTHRVDPATPLPERTSMIHLGTPVTSGRGVAVVTAVGESTELGRIGQLVRQSVTEATPLEKQLQMLGRRLVQLVLVIAIIAVVAGVWRGEPLFPMIEFGISLAVAAVPEGLPAVTTLILAVGVLRMARRHAIVRRLPAVETLGSTTVICTDKTGTLTQNRLTVRAVDARDVQRALTVASLCNDAIVSEGAVLGDPTEVALVDAAERAGIDVAQLRQSSPKLHEFPFDHETKRMITTHAREGGVLHAMKGAPSVVIAACDRWLRDDGSEAPLTQDERRRLHGRNEQLASKALRVLAVAERRDREDSKTTDNFLFLGFIGMADPPREGAAAAIADARRAGVRVVMLTGDQVETARAIARELHISGDAEPRVVHATDLARPEAEGADVFARVSPADKLQIVAALREHGDIVAVTGDGVNDAPALRKADIGVAMGRGGTEIARQAADLILTDDNLGTVVEAIRHGRTIYANIGKFVHLMFSHNLGEVVTVFVAMAFGLPLPLLPLQILWLNLVTDIFPAFALALEPPDEESTRRPSRTGALLDRSFLTLVAWQGTMLAALALTSYTIALQRYGGGAHARTIALTALVAVQLGHTFNCRSRVASAFGGVLRRPYLWLAVAAVVALQALAMFFSPLARPLDLTPLLAFDWAMIAGCATLPIAIVETQKLLARSRRIG